MSAVISQPVAEGEPRPRGEHLAAAGDERTAVEDRAARFVAEQVGEGELTPNVREPSSTNRSRIFLLAERKMARGGIEQNVGAAGGEARTGAIGDPGVAADFDADPHAAAVEEQVADRVLAAVDFDAADGARRPAAEPARLVVNAVAGEVLLGVKPSSSPSQTIAAAL